jgi:putative transposase
VTVVGSRDVEVVALSVACAALSVSRASLYRDRRPPAPRVERVRAPSPRRLDEGERQRILDTLHTPEFVDQPPTEAYATLLGRGTYLGSIRTMYRVLAEAGESQERRPQRAPHTYATPSLTATAPNQVWTWDITKLATLQKGVFLMAYVIIDLFSRYVVGWMVAPKECQRLAAQLFKETIARHGVEPGLTVHADRGSAMKSDTLAQLLASLGVSRSFSRPRVSNDNPFSEAQFKTLKYQPDYPGRFADELAARTYLGDFFGWHNEQHHHSGLELFTPGDVFHGRVELVAERRQAALDAAYREHPERFLNGPPRVRRPPTEVHINPLTSDAVQVAPTSADARDASTINARGVSTSDARDASTINARDVSTGDARGASTNDARGVGTSDARDASTINARDVSSSDARDASTINARDVSASDARGVGTSDARGVSTINARDVSTSDARDVDTNDARGAKARSGSTRRGSAAHQRGPVERPLRDALTAGLPT